MIQASANTTTLMLRNVVRSSIVISDYIDETDINMHKPATWDIDLDQEDAI